MSIWVSLILRFIESCNSIGYKDNGIYFNAPGAGCMDLGVPILLKMCLALEAYMYIKNGMANLKSSIEGTCSI